MRDMQVPKGNGRIAGVISLTLAAGLLLFLTGCQGPLAPSDAAGTGTVSLTIDAQGTGRAIMPEGQTMASFDAFSVVFSHAAFSDVTRDLTPPQAAVEVTLTAGDWTLTVTGLYDGEPLARAVVPFTLAAGGDPSLTATLLPIREDTEPGAEGTFAWNLTFPAGTTVRRYIRELTDAGGIGSVIIAHNDYNVGATWTGTLDLLVDDYFVVFALEHPEHGTLEFGRDLHIFWNLTSTFTETFAAAEFIPHPLPPALGDFINLVGMPAQAWQGEDIEAGPVDVDAGQPLRDFGDPTLTWIAHNGGFALSITDRDDTHYGISITTSYLGFSALGAYEMTITGTTAGTPALRRMPDHRVWDIATLDQVGDAFTFTTTGFSVAGLAATAIRIEGTTGEDIVITGITFNRIGSYACPECGAFPACPIRDCGRPSCECDCPRPELFVLSEWLPTVTSIGFGTVPLSCTAGGNVSIVDNGLVVGLAQPWDGVEFSSPGDVVVFDFTSNQYYIEVTGNIVGAHTGPIVIGMEAGGAENSIGSSGDTLTGPDAPFTVSGYINSTTFPLAGSHIRIRPQGGATSFRIDEIVITRVAATDAMLIAAAQEFGQAAVGSITPSVDVTAGTLLSAVIDVIPNTDINVDWGTPGFNLNPPVGATSGSITGTIVLTLRGVTENVVVDLEIPGAVDGYVFNMNELLTADEVQAHFNGHANRGMVSVTGTPGAWVVTGDRIGQGPNAGGLNDPAGNGWALIHILSPGQVAAGDTITIRFSFLRNGEPFAMTSSPIWWDQSTSGNAVGPQGGNIPGGSIHANNNTAATPVGGRTMEFEATPEVAANGLSLRWNSWGATEAGSLANADVHSVFSVVIYDAFVER